MTNADENTSDGLPFLKELLISVAIFVLLVILMELVKVQLDLVFHILLCFVVGCISFITLTYARIPILMSRTGSQIASDNRDIIGKIHRDLVRTNAIIPIENKLSITARILSDFVDQDVYHMTPEDYQKTTSIDLVRMFAYQNLIFTPQYLEYLFYRKDHSRTRNRIVVIDEVCQATITYLFLSFRTGYDTYIIQSKRFKDFVDKHCGAGKDRLRKMIKGNPYMLKIDNGSPIFVGKYIDFRNNDSIENISGTESWELLMKLKEASQKIENKNDMYQISSVTALLNNNLKSILPD